MTVTRAPDAQVNRWTQAQPGSTLAALIATLAASLVLIPLFDSPSFLGPVALVAIAVNIAGLLSRAVSLPLPLHPIAMLLALVTMLTWLYALPEAFLAVLPGPAAIEALRDLAQLGVNESQILVAPVPTNAALTILAAGGVGLVGICVDVIGVSLRMPALAGIPLLVLYSLPAAVLREGVTWWLLPIAILGWLLLLASDAQFQLTRWGRPLRPQATGPGAKGAGPRAHARGDKPRIAPQGWLAAIVAIALAISIPAVIPGLDNPVWGTGRGTAVPGTGSNSDIVSLDPFVSLRRNLVNNSTQEVLRMQSDSTDPGYLRLNTLTDFDGVRWSSSESFRVPLAETLPPPELARSVDREDIAYSISVGPLDNPGLPVPFAALRVEGTDASLSDAWTWDPVTRTVIGDGVSSLDQDYSVLAQRALPTRAQLQRFTSVDSPAGTTALPSDLDPLVAQLAAEVTQGATTPYEQAAALERWFTTTGGFTYSTSILGDPDTDPVVDFLQERVGYCEQFAATMALMARSLGIPSRVNVGFTSGQQVEPNVWSVQGRNAHAWPELWFDQVGWVWFEPTPRSDTTAGVVAPPYSDRADADQPTPAPSTQAPQPPEVVVPDGASAGTEDAASPMGWVILVGLLTGAVLAAIGLIVPGLVIHLRRRRGLNQPDPDLRMTNAWKELTLVAGAWGWSWPASMTPRQAIATWLRTADLGDPTKHELAQLLWWVEQARYARGDTDLSSISGPRLQAVISDVERALQAKCRWWQRQRARWATAWSRGTHRRADAWAWPVADNPWLAHVQRSDVAMGEPAKLS